MTKNEIMALGFSGIRKEYADCFDCSNCSRCFDCSDCSYCVCCRGLNGGQYQVKNVQLTEKEYREFMAK